jgi:hypothetical protein
MQVLLIFQTCIKYETKNGMERFNAAENSMDKTWSYTGSRDFIGCTW